MGKKNRIKKRRLERESRPRPAVEPPSMMKFLCPRCGTYLEAEGSLVAGGATLTRMSTGEVISLGAVPITHECPRCGAQMDAVNQFAATDGEDTVTGFVSNQADADRLLEAMAELKKLRSDATVDEVVAVLEADPQLRPLADYVRKHHLALASLGVGLVSLVIGLLAWLMPVNADDPMPAPPPGVTEEQMERLIDAVERQQPPAPLDADENEPDQGQQQADQGEE